MLTKEAEPRDWSPAEPVPSVRAVSLVSASQVSYCPPMAPVRRPHAFASLLIGALTLAIAIASNLLQLNGWLVASAGLTAVAIGAAAMHQAPWLGGLARISATLGMTMGLAASTLMLLPLL